MTTKRDPSICELADTIVRQSQRCQEAARLGDLKRVMQANEAISFAFQLAERDGKSHQLAAYLRARQF